MPILRRSVSLLVCSAVVLLAVACESYPELVPENGTLDDSSKSIADDTGADNEGDSSGLTIEDSESSDAEDESADEPTSVCGNGELEPGEICDDGGTKNGDGCSKDCITQDPEFDCSTPGQACIDTVVCGNGVIEGSETCDDSNETSGDGCSADCLTRDEGYICARPGTACILLPVCGNGARERGEQCDDNDNSDAADGCHECAQAADYFCIPGQACVPETCGDANRTPDEQCDDGGTSDGDGCSSSCTTESGWRCNATGCVADCGDGAIVTTEGCDDGNRTSGDGCSAACQVESYFTCSGAPSMCTSMIVCGNGVKEPGEVCESGPGADYNADCRADCSGYQVLGSVCGNSTVEPGEACETGAGCNTSTCQPATGYSCPTPTTCFLLPFCGDGTVNSGEECDDTNAVNNDGCSNCTIDSGYVCEGFVDSNCVEEVCGNAFRTDGEDCEDGNLTDDDGCTSCSVDTGYVCPAENESCLELCGDGLVVGNEECDDSNDDAGDGCNAACRIEAGFSCTVTGSGNVKNGGSCSAAVCGNGDPDDPTTAANEAEDAAEPGEGCDDGNEIAGDGCGPTCQLEPVVTVGPNPSVATFCGDGLITGAEECDDGNLLNDDGCSSTCEFEGETDGTFTCSESLVLPPTVEIAVTYRDFKVANAPGGHPDFEFQYGALTKGIAGARCEYTNRTTCGRLDVDGKPDPNVSVIIDNQALTKSAAQSASGKPHGNSIIKSPNSFKTWYRDPVSSSDENDQGYVGYNGTVEVKKVEGTLTLEQTAAGSSAYQYESSAHRPLDSVAGTFGGSRSDGGDSVCNSGAGVQSFKQGCINMDAADNYAFTTELRYFFQYKGGEVLTFSGDDDVWVYINGKLALDLGGLHQPEAGRVVLGDDGYYDGSHKSWADSNCTKEGGTAAVPNLTTCLSTDERADDDDSRFGLTKDEVYEIVLFHAERHSDGSNFDLTLDGFLAPRTSCEPTCGDGVVVGYEVCDDGAANSATPASGGCNDTCTRRAFCGDDEQQSGESCDNGASNDVTYLTSADPSACAPGCVAPPNCGDSVVQALYEECDNGSNNSPAYAATLSPSTCTSDCTLPSYCGDGVDDSSEACDRGLNNGVYDSSQSESCSTTCTQGPYCGDGVRNGPEQCDDGDSNNDNDCANDCTVNPICGDGLLGTGEACDNGAVNNNGAYGGCTMMCQLGPLCGDDLVQSTFEECDDGVENGSGYGKCSPNCFFGPRCGDGVRQEDEGEACDNGFNDDTYAFSSDSCGAGCAATPSCGDRVVQSSFELCDEGDDNQDGAYEGCQSDCSWGPFCGDGLIESNEEACDDGLDNTAYSSSGSACGYDCQPAAFCGDATRNGPEQCDEGSDENTGGYGKCKSDCTKDDYCGDGVVQDSEECDDGPTGSLDCSISCQRRDIIK